MNGIYRDQFPHIVPKKDKNGHYPGCYFLGCKVTRCKDLK